MVSPGTCANDVSSKVKGVIGKSHAIIGRKGYWSLNCSDITRPGLNSNDRTPQRGTPKNTIRYVVCVLISNVLNQRTVWSVTDTPNIAGIEWALKNIPIRTDFVVTFGIVKPDPNVSVWSD